MATAEETLDAREILTTEDVGLDKFQELRRHIHCHIERRSELERIVGEWKSLAKQFSSDNKAETRRGIALWLLGQVEQAIPVFLDVRATRERAYFLGVCYLDVGKHAEALEQLKEAHKEDSGSLEIGVAYAEARIKTGDVDGARGMIERLEKKYEHSADVPYVKGLWHDLQGFSDDALECYDRALSLEPGHPRALFRLAYVHDLKGDDASAVEYYQQLRKLRPVHVNTMINLGVLYEDKGDYERAADCYRSILEYFPNHSRAKLYYSDAQAALNMFYDEEAARRDVKLKALLSQPVAEISFSPRVRNALQKLDIVTLTDLVSRSEEELLGIPNFGKTSLRELKEFLASKGLGLSSGDAPAGGALGAAGGVDPGQRPLGDFEWSGRLMKIFETSRFRTIGDLLKYSKKDLLAMKNLGPTSIEEIEARLSTIGLKLPD